MSAHTSTRMPGDPSETVAHVASAGRSWEAWPRLSFRGGARHSRGLMGLELHLRTCNVTAPESPASPSQGMSRRLLLDSGICVHP